MEKIATHNSATGERSKNLLHALCTPFARCQTKTIRDQWFHGVRYFDLRVDKNLVLCHGLWKSNKTLFDVLLEMRKYVNETTYIEVTIEHNHPEEVVRDIYRRVCNMVNLHGRMVKLVAVNCKKPQWTCLKRWSHVDYVCRYLSVPTFRQYYKMEIKDWRRYIPIPRYLKTITAEPAFNEQVFTMVDFI